MLHRLLGSKRLADLVFLLTFERMGLDFRPGQYCLAGPAGLGHLREYSIASPPEAEVLRILVKRVDGGFVSPLLTEMRPGEMLEIRGPFGEFLPPAGPNARLLLAATGTGIAPYASIVPALPGLDYELLHGVRYPGEEYLHDEFDERRLHRCVSRGEGGYRGRITDYFLDNRERLSRCDYIYACGNSDMIYELFALARAAGFRREQLKAEIYF